MYETMATMGMALTFSSDRERKTTRGSEELRKSWQLFVGDAESLRRFCTLGGSSDDSFPS